MLGRRLHNIFRRNVATGSPRRLGGLLNRPSTLRARVKRPRSGRSGGHIGRRIAARDREFDADNEPDAARKIILDRWGQSEARAAGAACMGGSAGNVVAGQAESGGIILHRIQSQHPTLVQAIFNFDAPVRREFGIGLASKTIVCPVHARISDRRVAERL